MHEILSGASLDLYHPQQYLRLKTWSDSASEESRSSFFSFKSRVFTRFIPKGKPEVLKQSIHVFFKMDMF